MNRLQLLTYTLVFLLAAPAWSKDGPSGIVLGSCGSYADLRAQFPEGKVLILNLDLSHEPRRHTLFVFEDDTWVMIRNESYNPDPSETDTYCLVEKGVGYSAR